MCKSAWPSDKLGIFLSCHFYKHKEVKFVNKYVLEARLKHLTTEWVFTGPSNRSQTLREVSTTYSRIQITLCVFVEQIDISTSILYVVCFLKMYEHGL